jgi:hypothetical protein
MPHNFRRDEADAPDVYISVFLAKAQPPGKMRAHHVAVQ